MSLPLVVPVLPRPVLSRWHYAGLALLFVAFAVYGSLVPFHPRAIPLAEAVSRFQTVLAQPLEVQSRSDWVANILLFLPLGFLLMGAGCCDRPWFAALFFVPVTALCVALSAAIEFGQLYFPPRVSSLNDVAAESLGGLLGALLWLVQGQRLTGTARRIWTEFGSRGTVSVLLPGYLAFVLVISVLPFDFTVSPVEIYHKYREGRVILTPFGLADVGGFEQVNKYFWNVALFVPVGLLLGHLPGRLGQKSQGWPCILGLGLLIAGAIEFAQLFVVSRYCDVTDVLTGALAVLVGWMMVPLDRRQPIPSWSTAGASDGFSVVRWGLLGVWLSVLIFMEWQPFIFSWDLEAARDRLHRLPLLPFLEYQRADYLSALDDFIHKILLFLPLGVLLAPQAPARAGSLTGLSRWLPAVAVALGLEAGQLLLPTRYASITDVLTGSVAAWVGLVITCRLRAVPQVALVLKGRPREFCR